MSWRRCFQPQARRARWMIVKTSLYGLCLSYCQTVRSIQALSKSILTVVDEVEVWTRKLITKWKPESLGTRGKVAAYSRVTYDRPVEAGANQQATATLSNCCDACSSMNHRVRTEFVPLNHTEVRMSKLRDPDSYVTARSSSRFPVQSKILTRTYTRLAVFVI